MNTGRALWERSPTEKKEKPFVLRWLKAKAFWKKRAAGTASKCLKHQRMEAASAGNGTVVVWDK